MYLVACGLYELITEKHPQGYIDLANQGCVTQKQLYDKISDVDFYIKKNKVR